MEINPTTIDVVIEPKISIIDLNNNVVPLKGDTGIQGDTGLSAYEVAIENGFEGSEQDWLNSFQDRANHIGTQPINTIDNLQTELDSKVNNSDIGVTVQPYDDNLVTYTQTEKHKLATIQDGAEVNVNADWNATTGDAVILNKPTLGTIASRDTNEFASAEQGLKADSAVQPDDLLPYETSTQLDARDSANRDRANHEGTQSINTIENLQSILDGKQPTGDYATNTALNTKEPVIITGTTGQYWRGDKSWQTLDKNAVGLSNVENTSDLNKPISTATQSALNLKANLASPTFTGQLILPNNSRINGIEHFYQTTKPITRGDGSALVIGDRWWKTDAGEEWFWNGTYWLSKQLYTWQGFYGSYSSGTSLNSSTNITNSQTLAIYPNVPVVAGISAILFERISFFYRASSNTSFAGNIEVYGGSQLLITIPYSDFHLLRDRHRALVYSINSVITYTANPLATDASSINFYLFLTNITSPLQLNRGSTQCYFREVLL
jgi:hypothetical protein